MISDEINRFNCLCTIFAWPKPSGLQLWFCIKDSHIREIFHIPASLLCQKFYMYGLLFFFMYLPLLFFTNKQIANNSYTRVVCTNNKIAASEKYTRKEKQKTRNTWPSEQVQYQVWKSWKLTKCILLRHI